MYDLEFSHTSAELRPPGGKPQTLLADPPAHREGHGLMKAYVFSCRMSNLKEAFLTDSVRGLGGGVRHQEADSRGPGSSVGSVCLAYANDLGVIPCTS